MAGGGHNWDRGGARVHCRDDRVGSLEWRADPSSGPLRVRSDAPSRNPTLRGDRRLPQPSPGARRGLLGRLCFVTDAARFCDAGVIHIRTCLSSRGCMGAALGRWAGERSRRFRTSSMSAHTTARHSGSNVEVSRVREGARPGRVSHGRPFSDDPLGAGTVRRVPQLRHALLQGGLDPLERLVPAGVRVDEHRAVVVEQQQTGRLRQKRVQAAGVGDLAKGDDQARRGNLPSLPNMSHEPRSNLVLTRFAGFRLRQAWRIRVMPSRTLSSTCTERGSAATCSLNVAIGGCSEITRPPASVLSATIRPRSVRRGRTAS